MSEIKNHSKLTKIDFRAWSCTVLYGVGGSGVFDLVAVIFDCKELLWVCFPRNLFSHRESRLVLDRFRSVDFDFGIINFKVAFVLHILAIGWCVICLILRIIGLLDVLCEPEG